MPQLPTPPKFILLQTTRRQRPFGRSTRLIFDVNTVFLPKFEASFETVT